MFYIKLQVIKDWSKLAVCKLYKIFNQIEQIERVEAHFWSFTYKLAHPLLIFTLNMKRGDIGTSIVLNIGNSRCLGWIFQYWSSCTDIGTLIVLNIGNLGCFGWIYQYWSSRTHIGTSIVLNHWHNFNW